jgi:hypothetical protein
MPATNAPGMNARWTTLWVLLAAGLFAYIMLVERHRQEPPRGPRPLLTGLDPESVQALEVRWPGNPPLRAERNQDRWWLVQPLRDPADRSRIRTLLEALTDEPVQTVLSTAELLQRAGGLEEFGLADPRATLWVHTPTRQVQIQFGRPTAPGDQVFVQVVGEAGLWVVSAEVLRLVPRQPEDWRQRQWIEIIPGDFDRLIVSNQWGRFALARSEHGQWSLVEPLRARADPDKSRAAWDALQQMQVIEFVEDDPEADLEGFGLLPPALSLSLLRGTNEVARFDFGRSPTNRADLVYARQRARSPVVTLPAAPLASWQVAYTEFRDRKLLRWDQPVNALEILGSESFAVHRLPGQWRLLPLDLPADAESVENVLQILRQLEVVEFVKDVVIEPDLARYGLAPPSRQIVLRTSAQSGPNSSGLLGELHFGLTQDDKTYARRPDESAVYAVRRSEVERLPVAAFELRDRRVWRLDESQIERVFVRQDSRQRELIRLGPYSWTLGPGSQGVIDSLAVGEAVHALCDLVAMAWLGVGETKLSELGFGPDAWSVTLHRRDGEEFTVTFAAMPAEPYLRGMVRLEGRPWVFLCPPAAGELARAYLSLPRESIP